MGALFLKMLPSMSKYLAKAKMRLYIQPHLRTFRIVGRLSIVLSPLIQMLWCLLCQPLVYLPEAGMISTIPLEYGTQDRNGPFLIWMARTWRQVECSMSRYLAPLIMLLSTLRQARIVGTMRPTLILLLPTMKI